MSNLITPHDQRLCICDTEIRTLEHCLLHCPLLQEIYNTQYNFTSIHTALESPNIGEFLLQMGKNLKIRERTVTTKKIIEIFFLSFSIRLSSIIEDIPRA